jgi:hypothetical protein
LPQRRERDDFIRGGNDAGGLERRDQFERTADIAGIDQRIGIPDDIADEPQKSRGKNASSASPSA